MKIDSLIKYFPILLNPPYLLFAQNSPPPYFFFRKEQVFKIRQRGQTKIQYDKDKTLILRLEKATLPEERALESETHSLPLLAVSQKHQGKSHCICAVTWYRPMFAISVSLNPCVPGLVDLTNMICWCLPSRLTPTVLFL